MRRRRNWSTPALLFGCLVLAGIVGGFLYFVTTEKQPGNGGTYTEGIAGSPIRLNPVLASSNDLDKDLTTLLFSGLTRLAADGSVLPDLADSWEISQDGRSYTFHLRKGAKWHDAQPVVADDVVFTFRLLQHDDIQANPELTALWKRVQIAKIDDGSVRITLDEPFAPFLSYTTLGILPSHLLQDTNPKDLASADFNARPVGTGSFRLKEATIDQVTLEANPASYRGRPFLDGITFRFFQDDQALAAALSTKQVQGGLLRPSAGTDAIASVQANSGLTVRALPRASYSVLFLNTRSPLFQDKTVRQAVAYSIDRQGLINNVMGGLGTIADSPLVPDSWAYDRNTTAYTYDPDRATKILESGGWKINSAGVLEKGGRALGFSLLTNNDKTRVVQGEALVRQLKKARMQVEIGASGFTGLLQNFLLPRKYDAILYGIDPGSDPDPYPLWHSSQASGAGLNVAAFSKPDMDGLLEKARTTVNLEDRKRLYEQFQSAFAEEMPSIPLYHPLYLYAVDRRVKGISLGVLYDTSSRFLNVNEWYMNTRRTWNLF